MTSHRIGKCLTVLLLLNALAAKAVADDTSHTRPSLGPDDLAVIVNDADSLSVQIGKYYKIKRQIPDVNIIHVRFEPGHINMNFSEFQKVKAVVDAATPQNIQAYALAWTIPYKVECMSITTAFAAGYDAGYCSKACAPTKPSPYFNSNSHRPYDDYHIRPTMSLAGVDFEQTRALIDRGVASDHTFPNGVGYLVSTSDAGRNVRAALYPDIIQKLARAFDLRLVKADFIKNKKGVLYYFTGIVKVDALDSLQFLPGAIADHLTSAGGFLTDSTQMSSLRWLEAGATGSYGAVSEPCNYLAKFPHPGIVMSRYYNGESLIEAYWKSVAWPGEGIFIGEPLAAPFTAKYVLSPEKLIQ